MDVRRIPSRVERQHWRDFAINFYKVSVGWATCCPSVVTILGDLRMIVNPWRTTCSLTLLVGTLGCATPSLSDRVWSEVHRSAGVLPADSAAKCKATNEVSERAVRVLRSPTATLLRAATSTDGTRVTRVHLEVMDQGQFASVDARVKDDRCIAFEAFAIGSNDPTSPSR